RSFSTTTTASAIARPEGSITRAALNAFVAAAAFEATRVMMTRWTNDLMSVCVLRISRSRFLDLSGNGARQRLGRAHAGEGAKTQNPALKGAIDADVQRHAHGSIVRRVELLRRVPLARADVVGDCRTELDLDMLWRSRVDAERIRERRVRQFL